MSTPRKMLMVRAPLGLLLSGCLAAAWLLTSGCEEKRAEPAPGPSPGPAATNVALRVAVAEDVELASVIERLRGEWAEQGGGEVQVERLTLAELMTPPPAGRNAPDLLVFPSRYLGEMCERDRLRAVRTSVLKSETLAFADIFPAIRDKEVAYGGRVMALPLGCPLPLLLYHDQEHNEPQPAPTSWEELPERFEAISHPPTGAAFPLAFEFLARSASYAVHPSREAVLFDAQSMTPRLAAPPFVRALDELVAMSGSAAEAAGADASNPSCAAALLWPDRDAGSAVGAAAAVALLPGARQVYDPLEQRWLDVQAEPRRVTLLGTSGRLLAVSAESRNAAAAFRYAVWLVSPQNARDVATASPGVAHVRRSLVRSRDDWTGADSGLGKQVAEALRRSLSAQHSIVAPRLLEVDAYLAALESGVQSAVAGTPASDALAAIAADWESLTKRIGRDAQRAAYRRHLGMDEYTPATR
ncbi:MAG: hypothetical protein AAGB00_00350 [Planctomycetota bacterium]